MNDISSYILSAYSFIFEYPLNKLLEAGYRSKYGNPIPSFDEDLLIELCSEAEQIFMKENNLLEITGDIIIVGDIHGSLHDLLRILKFTQEQNTKVLFLGDYIDRGNFSLECITLLYALKIAEPDRFFLIRGNHEFDSICNIYGFKDEILNYHNPKMHSIPQPTNESKQIIHSSKIIRKEPPSPDRRYIDRFTNDINCYKYTENLYQSFIRSFSYLPIAAKLNTTTFCIHGGLSKQLEFVDQINTLIQRPIDNIEDNNLISDLVWSDPSHSANRLFEDNPRGRGCLFNREAVGNFLKKNSLTRMIRAHQCIKKGVEKMFNDKFITVFSASSYDKEIHNYSSIIQLFEKDDTIKYHIFKPLTRLEKCDCSYYKVQARNYNEEKIRVCFSFLHPKLLTSTNDRQTICKTNTRQIRSFKSENSLYKYNLNSSKFSNLFRPKFVTNMRKSLNSVSIQSSFTDCDYLPSEEYDNSNLDSTDG